MDDTKKMLRTIINGQSAMKSELLGEIKKVDKKVDLLKKSMDKGFKDVNARVDKLGKSLAYLEDDAPTREEFEDLDKRVGNLEENFTST
ncbi:MAG: hypothetical protein A2562_00095 [Candidatus Nealsonbacteria bacterium RIFOXYD1_FULL_39_11]|nr:MAG: hypothetical protein A2562_00095 [Candidatus Nealsonbacteria bacterium RIFOXYD1_FULL_39_11]